MMDQYLSRLESLATTYDGSSESSSQIEDTINFYLNWYLFSFCVILNQEYVKKKIVPVYRKLEKALKTVHSENKSFTKKIIKTVDYTINILKNYIQTGEFKCVSDEKMKELLALTQTTKIA